jgi:hypothetical protein
MDWVACDSCGAEVAVGASEVAVGASAEEPQATMTAKVKSNHAVMIPLDCIIQRFNMKKPLDQVNLGLTGPTGRYDWAI